MPHAYSSTFPASVSAVIMAPDGVTISPRGVLTSLNYEMTGPFAKYAPGFVEWVEIHGGQVNPRTENGMLVIYGYGAQRAIVKTRDGEQTIQDVVSWSTRGGSYIRGRGGMFSSARPTSTGPGGSSSGKIAVPSRAVTRRVAAPSMTAAKSARLRGVPMIGFMEIFEDAHGDGSTPRPYPVVVPSAVGPALLPFRCPHCGEACPELVDPEKRWGYFDKAGKFSWCPCADCRKRFFVDRTGAPLAESLPAGAVAAPSWVERDGVRVANPRDRSPLAHRDVGRFAMLGAVSL